MPARRRRSQEQLPTATWGEILWIKSATSPNSGTHQRHEHTNTQTISITTKRTSLPPSASPSRHRQRVMAPARRAHVVFRPPASGRAHPAALWSIDRRERRPSPRANDRRRRQQPDRRRGIGLRAGGPGGHDPRFEAAHGVAWTHGSSCPFAAQFRSANLPRALSAQSRGQSAAGGAPRPRDPARGLHHRARSRRRTGGCPAQRHCERYRGRSAHRRGRTGDRGDRRPCGPKQRHAPRLAGRSRTGPRRHQRTR